MKADIISYIRNGISEESINLTLIQKELEDIRTRFPLDEIPNMKIEEWVTVGDKYCLQDIYDFIVKFNPDTYDSKKILSYISEANVVKAKLIMIYRPDCKVCGFTSKTHAKKLAKYLGIIIGKREDALSINIKINKYILDCEPSFNSVNTYILGRLIWDFYAEHVLVKNDNSKYLVIDRKNDAKINEKIDDATYPDDEELKPRPAPNPIEEKGAFKYPRNPAISKQALKNAKYLCECGRDHVSFIRKTNGKNYTEPHHIIPMSAQDDFENSTDVDANIVSLCPVCHRKLHHGMDVEPELKKLYDCRIVLLKQSDIDITFDALKKYYK